MTDINTFNERIKNLTLYEQRNPDSLPTDILKLGPGRMNERLAKWSCSTMDLVSTFPVALRDKFNDAINRTVHAYQKIDGWAVSQSVMAEGQKVLKQDEEKKRGGILGIMG